MLTAPLHVACCCLAHSKGAGTSSKQGLPSKNINKLLTMTHLILCLAPATPIPHPLQIHLHIDSPALFQGAYILSKVKLASLVTYVQNMLKTPPVCHH
jgi:hypothetical protein